LIDSPATLKTAVSAVLSRDKPANPVVAINMKAHAKKVCINLTKIPWVCWWFQYSAIFRTATGKMNKYTSAPLRFIEV
jgi:hypothetical protein